MMKTTDRRFRGPRVTYRMLPKRLADLHARPSVVVTREISRATKDFTGRTFDYPLAMERQQAALVAVAEALQGCGPSAEEIQANLEKNTPTRGNRKRGAGLGSTRTEDDRASAGRKATKRNHPQNRSAKGESTCLHGSFPT